MLYLKTLNPLNIFKIKNYQEQWVNREMSSFEYISRINALTSRTYHDFTRHPIFPSVIRDYSSNRLEVIDYGTINHLKHSILSGIYF